MTLRPAIRRLAVTAGLAVAVLGAAGTILAASQWAATEAPLDAPPVSIESMQQALDAERERSAALEQQIAALETASGELTAALSASEAQLATDAAAADDLRAALDAAQAKLAKLEAALKAAAASRTSTVTTSTTASSGGEREDGEAEDHEEEDHPDEPDEPGDD